MLAAAGSVVASPSLWLGSLALVAAAIACQAERRPTSATHVAFVVWACAAWAIGNSLVNPAYTPAGVFHPLFLLAGFALARSASARERDTVFTALAAGAAALAAWGLWQSATGGGRAHAHFETPNTLAAVLNLALAPLVFRIAHGDARRHLPALAIVMAAGVVATLSRGGWIALAAGLVAAMLTCPVRAQRAAVWRAAAALLAGAAVGGVALMLPQWLSAQPLPAEAQPGSLATTLVHSVASRGELYRLAFSAVGEHPWLGSGYLGFQALFEAHRAEVPSYATLNITYFVHDDYLQTLVELGLPGLATLIAMIVLPFWRARRASGTRADRSSLYAPLAGIATMAIHALGDFPFYVPICLLMFGVLLGLVDGWLSSGTVGAMRPTALPARLAAIVLGALAAVALVAPALAEAAAAYGDRSWRSNQAQPAAYGLELARRLAPRDWRYHWYAGQFWYAQAQAGNAAAAQLADQAFAAAVAANAREPRALLARLATQMRFGRMLEHPQPAATLRQWADRALALAPLNPAVRRDHAAALERLSRAP